MGALTEAGLLSVATAWLAFTVSDAALFAPLREWTGRRSPWLGKLLACGYCTGFWIALGLVAVYRPRLLSGWWPLDYLLSALVVAWLAAFQWIVLCWLMERTGK